MGVFMGQTSDCEMFHCHVEDYQWLPVYLSGRNPCSLMCFPISIEHGPLKQLIHPLKLVMFQSYIQLFHVFSHFLIHRQFFSMSCSHFLMLQLPTCPFYSPTWRQLIGGVSRLALLRCWSVTTRMRWFLRVKSSWKQRLPKIDMFEKAL